MQAELRLAVASHRVARRLPPLSRLLLLLVAPLVQVCLLNETFLADDEIWKFRIAPCLFDCERAARQIARGGRSIEPSRCYIVYVDDDRLLDRTVPICHVAPFGRPQLEIRVSAC
jgi:hypothetical protein